MRVIGIIGLWTALIASAIASGIFIWAQTWFLALGMTALGGAVATIIDISESSASNEGERNGTH